MRVIAGKFRSRNLKTGDNFRPTTDRTRETLFNILQTEIEGSTFMDAFAGSGSVGIEALSRSARRVYFIESNRKALRVLEQNLLSCCEQESWRIFTTDVWKAL
jgi:16S rRNA (guanine966-N2)-methyltransferase